MSYVGRRELRDIAETARDLAAEYATKGKREMSVDCVAFGYITVKYGYTIRRALIRSQRKLTRIDYLHGGTGNGTYIELVARRRVQERNVTIVYAGAGGPLGLGLRAGETGVGG